MNANDLEKTFDFYHQIEKLKSALRYNSKCCGSKETVADHCWRLSLMVFVTYDQLNLQLDLVKIIKIAICHDLAESVTGDIDAIKMMEGKITKEEKNKMETDAMSKICAMLPQKQSEEIFGYWQEYENNESEEAKYVKAMDKIETLTQLIDAGYKTYDKPEFIANYADKAVTEFPKLFPVLKIVKERLEKEFIKGKFPWKNEYDKAIPK